MPKYHVSPETGRPNICRAQKQCPLKTEDGKPAPHYNSKEEARAGVEKIEAAKNQTFTQLKKPNKTKDKLSQVEEPSLQELEDLEKELEETPLEELDFNESEILEEINKENAVKKWKNPKESKALQAIVSSEEKIKSGNYIGQVNSALTAEVMDDDDYYYRQDEDNDYYREDDYYANLPNYTGYVEVDSKELVNNYYNSIAKEESKIGWKSPDTLESKEAKKIIARVFSKYDLFNENKYSAIDSGFGEVSYECEADVDGAINEIRQILGVAPEEY